MDYNEIIRINLAKSEKEAAESREFVARKLAVSTQGDEYHHELFSDKIKRIAARFKWDLRYPFDTQEQRVARYRRYELLRSGSLSKSTRQKIALLDSILRGDKLTKCVDNGYHAEQPYISERIASAVVCHSTDEDNNR